MVKELIYIVMVIPKVLTTSPGGHTLHHNGVFSKDGRYIVFDGRNDDTKIGENNYIGVVDLKEGGERVIYYSPRPGVGAASFSPVEDKVIFIHGVGHYGISNRTGVAVHFENPMHGIFMDARDLNAPYTPGSLRGGTHSHMWSPDGKMLSFTYNDALVEPDLRTVGVMFPGTVQVEEGEGNNSGTYYSYLVAEVSKEGDLQKAFDECWLNQNTIAFQGLLGNKIEVFLVKVEEKHVDEAIGMEGQRPQVPGFIRPIQLTHTEKGLSSTRHWLRAHPSGKFLYALVKDAAGLDQIAQISAASGEMKILTTLPYSIDYPFNLSPDGRYLTFVSNNAVHILDLQSLEIRVLKSTIEGKVVGAPHFSPNGEDLVYNQYINGDLQILLIEQVLKN
jgi:WD40 repeat protein